MAAAGGIACSSEETGREVGLVGVSGTLLVVAGGGAAVTSKPWFGTDVDVSCSVG